MQENKERINYASETVRRLNQIICYLTTFWPPDVTQPFKNQSKLVQMKKNINQSQNTKLSIRNHKSQSNEIQNYKLIGNKMFLPANRSKNQQIIKLKNVNNFLKVIDTNLIQVIQGLKQIHDTIIQYEDIEKIHNKYSYEKKQIYKQQKMNNNKQYRRSSVEIMEQNYDINTFNNIFKYINDYLFKDNFIDILKKSPKQLAVWILQIQTKLSILPQLIQSASKFTIDITTCQPNTQKYMYAWKNITVVQMDKNKQKISKQIDLLKRMMKITTSAVVAQNQTLEVTLARKIAFGLSFPYYWLADVQSQLKCYKIWRKPKIEVLNLVWNMPENGAISKLKSITFPSIKTSFFIYVPSLNNSQFKTKSSLLQDKSSIFQKPLNSQQYIRVLVLYYTRLPFQSESRGFQPFGCCMCLNDVQDMDIETILIHIHGGGFVALSSETSQTYTRKWANQLKIPIFSIDYRKPPNKRFPIPLQDCLRVYEFLVENINKYFKIQPKNIIIAGDSAGGNLVVALQAMLLQKKYNVMPIGIFLAYPAVDLRMKFSPSRLNSLDDPILLPPLLLLCLKEYLGQNTKNQQNPFASPILLSQFFIQTGRNWNYYKGSQCGKWPKNWPVTKIMVGKKDPLFDDSLRLLQRMAHGGADANLIIYNQLSHAFLSLDNVIPACSQAIQDSIKQIKKLLSL